ncbi:chitosanase [Foetidibacter luteolus]|uniref:chitosanase n=1 Tax=Foetidibacter luteolus TaxID=2608880 RepID=UPI001A9931FD|nr:chitosanase [Foetidibacter luteolus]
MAQLIVKANKLNKRSSVPAFLPDNTNITGVVLKNFVFQGDEVTVVPNPSLGKWYKDRDNQFYWGGGLNVLEPDVDDQAPELVTPDNETMENAVISPVVKKKIEQVINAFETGSAQGNYATLVKYPDYTDPDTGNRIVQVTFGRSQTTEFGHLKALVQDYVDSGGAFATALSPFLPRLGKKPSLATNDEFCNALKNAGKNDPLMKVCQDRLFDAKYYQPAYKWFSVNGFTLPLSLLTIYDSIIHSGSILGFLRKRFNTVVPASGGNEKEWITNYINARNSWLANHSSTLLQKTVYRTKCLQQQAQQQNWNLSAPVNANGITIS